MKKRWISACRTAATLSALAILLGGCFGTSRNAKFYTLAPVAGEEANPSGDAGAGGRTVGLGPILLPPYLDRPQIVTRVNASEVRFDEFHRWAAPVDEQVREVLLENLSTLLRGDRVVPYPWKGTISLDCRVEIDVSRFDGNPGDAVTLETRWRVLDRDGGEVLQTRTSVIRVPVAGMAYADLVAAKSRALAELSREIAKALEDLV